MADRTFVFLINPEAGRRLGRRLAEQIRAVFEAHGLGQSCRIELTESSGHASELAKAMGETYGDRGVIFACGGDGTIHETVNGLHGTGAALGILPLGTGNDFARHILPSLKLEDLLPRLPDPDIRPIDLMQVNGELCINITSFGLDSRIQQIAERLQRRYHIHSERLLYNLSIVVGLLGGRAFDLEYELRTAGAGEGCPETQTGHMQMVLSAICNGSYYGGGFNPAPAANSADGILDIVLIDNLPLGRILQLLPRYKAGTHLGDPAVHLFQAREGVFRTRQGSLPGNYDGELFEASEIQFKILPAALPFAYYPRLTNP